MPKSHDRHSIAQWIQQYIGNLLAVPAEDIEVDIEFASYGLTSSTAVTLLADLEEVLGIWLSPALLFEYTTVNAISQHLEAELRKAAPSNPTAQP